MKTADEIFATIDPARRAEFGSLVSDKRTTAYFNAIARRIGFVGESESESLTVKNCEGTVAHRVNGDVYGVYKVGELYAAETEKSISADGVEYHTYIFDHDPSNYELYEAVTMVDIAWELKRNEWRSADGAPASDGHGDHWLDEDGSISERWVTWTGKYWAVH